MNARKMAELIMLQSIADLWDEQDRSGSIDFFRGDGFTLCADIAGMDLYDQIRMLNMVSNVVEGQTRGRKKTIRKPKTQLAQQA